MKLDYASYLANPNLRSHIEADARRQRALEVNRLVLALAAALFHKPQKAGLQVAACH